MLGLTHDVPVYRLLGAAWVGEDQPNDYGWLPENKRPRVILESRITLAVYASVGVAAVAFGSSAPLIYWLIPRLVSEPLMRWLRVTEHVGCAEGSDIRTNTRTTKANPLLRFFFWNMPYHAEHHLCPSVPFHRLPALHRAVGDQLQEMGQGYIAVHRDILRNHLTGILSVSGQSWRGRETGNRG